MAKISNPSTQKADAAKVGSKRQPVVFMFQPTEFVLVQSDKMKEWEEGLKAALGANAPKIHQLLSEGGYRATTSICRPGGADDCDEIADD